MAPFDENGKHISPEEAHLRGYRIPSEALRNEVAPVLGIAKGEPIQWSETTLQKLIDHDPQWFARFYREYSDELKPLVEHARRWQQEEAHRNRPPIKRLS